MIRYGICLILRLFSCISNTCSMNEVQLRSLIIKTGLQLKAFLSLHVFSPIVTNIEFENPELFLQVF